MKKRKKFFASPATVKKLLLTSDLKINLTNKLINLKKDVCSFYIIHILKYIYLN